MEGKNIFLHRLTLCALDLPSFVSWSRRTKSISDNFITKSCKKEKLKINNIDLRFATILQYTSSLKMLYKLPNHPILKYHPDTLSYVRSLYDLEKLGHMDEAIDKLEDWIKKQPYFIYKQYPREYLERTIISCKGSIERAKTRIDKNCTFRTLMPHLVQESDIKKIKPDGIKFFCFAAPKLTEDHYRVIVVKVNGSFKAKSLQEFYTAFLIFTEYMKAHDYSTGVTYILDYSEVDMFAYLSCINPLELRDLISVLVEGYGVRMKGIHMFTPSKAIETVVGIFKRVVSEKIGRRIFVHRDVESLHKVVSKEYLPADYGGEEKSIGKQFEEWIEILGTKENIEYQKEMNKAGIDEAMRPRSEHSESHLGISGTFRTLSVD